MRVAHVAPYPYCRLTADRGYHLCEARIAIEDQQYLNFYTQLARKGHHVILDNGAHESDAITPHYLQEIAQKVGATTVIMPDKLTFSKETLRLSSEANMFIPPWKRMYVPQGVDLDDWLDCFFTMTESWEVEMIGIPKICEEYDEGRRGILEYLQKHGYHFSIKVHLLGTHGEYPLKSQVCIPNEFPWVYGMDTGKAAAYAQNHSTVGTLVDHSLDWEAPVDKGYFDINMTILERWAA